MYVVVVEGLDGVVNSVDDLPMNVRRSAARALNQTATRTRTKSSEAIRRQVAFPASYLGPSQGRLKVTRKANPADLKAEITGRQRATSLARFLTTRPKRGEAARVRVSPGSVKAIPRAFAIPLRAGSAPVETRANLGLAIRLGPGESLRNKRTFKRLANGLYLLYGPSVDQVFRDVAEEESAPAAAYLERTFLRLVNL